jgi:hypothetical protein
LEQALGELQKLQESKDGEQAKAQVRVSETDPQARIMKQNGGGYAPSYNVQLSTDATKGLIVGVGLSQAGNDYGELLGALQRVERTAGSIPQQLVADAGFCNRENIVAMAQRGIELIGSMETPSPGYMQRLGITEAFYPKAFAYDAEEDAYRCPAGKSLPYHRQEKREGVIYHRYRALLSTCAACQFKAQCCPQNQTTGRAISRIEESPAMQDFRDRMQTQTAKAIYRQRAQVAEFPNAWIKTKLGLRQFHVRGLLKVAAEALWGALTYNIQQWMRLIWRPQVQFAT